MLEFYSILLHFVTGVYMPARQGTNNQIRFSVNIPFCVMHRRKTYSIDILYVQICNKPSDINITRIFKDFLMKSSVKQMTTTTLITIYLNPSSHYATHTVFVRHMLS